MGALDGLIALMSTFKFWLIWSLVVVFAWGFVGKYMKKVKISKGFALTIGLVALFLSAGGTALLGMGSIGSSASASTVTQLQTTAAYTIANSTTASVSTDSGTDDTRMSVFYLDTGDINGDANITTGIFKVRRLGNLDPASCEVQVFKPARYEISDTTYHLVNEDASTGVMDAWVHTAATTGAATEADPKGSNSLAFADGVDSGFVSFKISLDETGIDPMTQYDSKDINVNICGYPYTFRIVKNY